MEFLQNLSPKHISAANQALEYLVATKYYAVQFDKKLTNKKLFITSSNLAFANNSNTWYSSYGFCFTLFRGVIYYKAIKGKTVTTLSTKAELLAILITAKDFIS